MSKSTPLDIVDGLTSRPLKRRATADLSFFTPSSITFNPKPYFPHSSHSINHSKPSAQASTSCQTTMTAPAQRPQDVPCDDPDAVFIRYPDQPFPGSDIYPEGLTYTLLSENPDWFLVPEDFKTEGDTSSDRVAYPQSLEPPRGWFPTKKKDVKEKGPEAYEGLEAPKLRCTFCRRAYAGVNAKSMWRRHILEKHKIPMSNRRDGPSEGRNGRSSNKENARASSSAPIDPGALSTSKTRASSSGLLPAPNGLTEPRTTRNSSNKLKAMFTTDKSPEIPSMYLPTTPFEQSESIVHASEPEFALGDMKASSTQHSPQFTGVMLPPSSPLDEATFQMSRVMPSSPVSPPHSSYRMPWKFPSPSHPLHAGPEELCLAVPIRGISGEGLRSSYVALQASPFPGTSPAAKQFSSPMGNDSPLSSRPVAGRVLGWKRSKGTSKYKLPPLPEPSPRRPRYSGPLPVPLTDRMEFGTPDLSASMNNEDADSSFSSLGEPFSSWFDLNTPGKPTTGAGDTGFPDTPIRKSAGSSSFDQLQLMNSGRESGAPSSRLPSGVGLGFNFKFDLMASKKRSRSDDGHDDDVFTGLGELMYPSPIVSPFGRHDLGNHRLVEEELRVPQELNGDGTSSTDAGSEDPLFEDYPPLKKRRKTL